MKSKALNIFGSALIALSAFFFVWTISQAEEGVQEYITQSLTVSSVLGMVEVLPKDAPDWEEASVGMQLTEGDQIRTAEGAKAELVLKDGSFIRMKERTTIGIKAAREEKTSQESEYNFDFRMGEIMVELKKLKAGSSFNVETPTAVAAVRGTTYYMRTGTREVEGTEQPFVEIYVDSDDVVMFTNTVSGESCFVHQGESAILFPDGTIDGPYPIPPSAQDAWKSGFDIKYDDSGEGKKGMRDEDEEGDEEDDTEDDVDDTTEDQEDAQDDANEDQSGEQGIYGLANVTIVTEEEEEEQEEEGTEILDSDGDGYSDGIDAFPFDPAEWFDTDKDGIGNNADTDDDGDKVWDNVEADNETNPLVKDSDGDSFDDFEDAFPKDDTVDPDTTFNDINENPVTVKGYGSWEQLRQAAIDNLELQGDIATMLDDIHARGYEAVKESVFDHQAGKVMTDRWGNRVRVEEYISKPSNDQVQILALNLRTAGPNAGVSSFDFRVKFDSDINNTDLKSLPWDDYMGVTLIREYDPPEGAGYAETPFDDYDEDAQLILYEKENPGYYDPTLYGYPIPLEFSLEVKNPYGDSVKAIERYGELDYFPREEETRPTIWFQVEEREDNKICINGQQYDESSNLNSVSDWGENWNQNNRFTFLDYYEDGKDEDTWLMGVFYLIDNNGQLVNNVSADYLDEEGNLDIEGIRALVNPYYNLEMVFFSSKFGTYYELPDDIAEKEVVDDAYERLLYQTYRNIDVITIPGITEPYRNHQLPELPEGGGTENEQGFSEVIMW